MKGVCHWLVLGPLLIVVGVAGATMLRNSFAGVAEVVRYLKDSGEMEFESWNFTPSEIDFSNTGVVYCLSFSTSTGITTSQSLSW